MTDTTRLYATTFVKRNGTSGRSAAPASSASRSPTSGPPAASSPSATRRGRRDRPSPSPRQPSPPPAARGARTHAHGVTRPQNGQDPDSPSPQRGDPALPAWLYPLALRQPSIQARTIPAGAGSTLSWDFIGGGSCFRSVGFGGGLRGAVRPGRRASSACAALVPTPLDAWARPRHRHRIASAPYRAVSPLSGLSGTTPADAAGAHSCDVGTEPTPRSVLGLGRKAPCSAVADRFRQQCAE